MRARPPGSTWSSRARPCAAPGSGSSSA